MKSTYDPSFSFTYKASEFVKYSQLQFDTKLVEKDPKLTEFDDDLTQKDAFSKVTHNLQKRDNNDLPIHLGQCKR